MTLYSKIVFKLTQIKDKTINSLYSMYAKTRLKNNEFCIICNNCFGGHLYETTNRPYNTPTVGLYFFAEDYIKFIENLDTCLKEEMAFIKQSRFEECHKEHQDSGYPIGLLSNNLEIHFLHYKSEDEARIKWNRRKARILESEILVIMNDQNRFSEDLMPRFNAVKYPKVFLSAKQRDGDDVTVVSYYKNKNVIGDMYHDKLKCLKDFDLVSWIRNQNL
jgi:uncharacterized protein (DUF1919 family)